MTYAIAQTIRVVRGELDIPFPTQERWWHFPSIAEYSRLLEDVGLEVVFAALADRTMPLDDGEAGLRKWLKTFAEQGFTGSPGRFHEGFYSRMESRLRVQLHYDGAWHADYRLIRAKAVKQGGTE